MAVGGGGDLGWKLSNSHANATFEVLITPPVPINCRNWVLAFSPNRMAVRPRHSLADSLLFCKNNDRQYVGVLETNWVVAQNRQHVTWDKVH